MPSDFLPKNRCQMVHCVCSGWGHSEHSNLSDRILRSGNPMPFRTVLSHLTIRRGLRQHCFEHDDACVGLFLRRLEPGRFEAHPNPRVHTPRFVSFQNCQISKWSNSKARCVTGLVAETGLVNGIPALVRISWACN